jgi:hypothetical protein
MGRTEVIEELRRIQDSNGGLLRAADVVMEASRPGSPLHDHFNWDDTEAAHQWRLQQARQLIRVSVAYLPFDEPHYQVRAFVSLTPDRQREQGGYRAMVSVLNAPSERQQLLLDALEELNRLKIKYHNLTELDSIFRGIERAQRNYGMPPPPQGFDNGGDIPASP